MDILRKFTVILATFSLAACGFMADAEEVETEVGLFRAAYDAQDWNTIWTTTSEEFRAVSSEDQWNTLMRIVRTKLGKSVSSERTGWNVNTGTSGTIAVLSFATTFEEGEATETFTYKKTDSGWRMQGYDIRSDVLLEALEEEGGEGPDPEAPATYTTIHPIPAPAE